MEEHDFNCKLLYKILYQKKLDEVDEKEKEEFKKKTELFLSIFVENRTLKELKSKLEMIEKEI